MKTKAQKICMIAKRFAEIKSVGQGNITIGFPSLWNNITDADVDFLLEAVNDADFEKRLEGIAELS